MRIFRLLIVSFFLLPLTCQAVGVSISPSTLDMVFPDVQQSELTITNISEEPVIITIQADDFSKNLIIQPQEVELLPQEITKVKIGGDFSGLAEGVKKTNISVITKALNKKSFNAASGLKIPLTINIYGQSYWQWSGAMVFIVVFASLLIIYFIIEILYRIFSRKKKKHWYLNLLKRHKKYPWHRSKQ